MFLPELQICPGRTWQSLKEHYIKQIIPKIDAYEKDVNIKSRMMFVFGGYTSKMKDGGECSRSNQPHDDTLEKMVKRKREEGQSSGYEDRGKKCDLRSTSQK
ncbi:uncharacterized protein LOC121873276 [Homarus americanus]|uniref:uncharacterized protein LOC121873276 n=1 Tax=Homarus americanus TaxID=6706 RepID=UPI001C464FD9|nr:uncharacterized protein LOC121873276 [Homarus americanus]